MRQLRSTFYLKTFLFFFHSIGILMTSYLPLFLTAKGLTGKELGWILAIGPLAGLIAEPLSGFLSDKYKTIKKVLLVALTGLVIMGFIFFQLNTFLAFLLTAYFFFFLMSPIGALSDSLSQKTADQAGIPFGKIRMWGSIGFGVTALLCGQLFMVIGIENILYPFLFFAVGSIILCFFITDVKVSNKPVNVKKALTLAKNRPFLWFLVTIIFVTIAHRTNDSFLSVHLMALGASESLVGWAWLIGVLTEAVIFALTHLWFRKFHELTFIMFAAFIYGLRFLLVSMVNDPVMILWLQPLHGITFGIFYTAAFKFVTNIVPQELQSTGHVLLVTVFFAISGIIGSLFGGFMIDTKGLTSLYQWIGILAWIGMIGVIIYKKYIHTLESLTTTDKSKARIN